MEKVKFIQEWLKMALVDDWVYLKVSPMKGVMRFGKKGNLVPGILDLIEYPRELTM